MKAFNVLDDLPGGSVFSRAYGISGNGQVIVGQSSSDLGSEAFAWSAANGV